MKTPRQVLFDRHRAAEPKLDALREKLLASMAPEPQDADDARTPAFLPALRALLNSLRWHAAGLGALWAIILVLHSASDAPAAPVLAKKSPPPRQLLMALRENRRQVLELIESPPTVTAPAPPSTAVPRRSEIQIATAMA